MPNLPLWPQIYLFPPAVVVGLWVGLTAGVVVVNRRGPLAGRIALLCSLPLLLLAHHELWAVRGDATVWGGYRSFAAGMAIWAWHELAFYCGVLTGPWRAPCPPGARGLFRFGYALGTHVYHELAVLAELALMLWLLHDGVNFLAPLVFVLSWALQHSAKLNVLLGVRSLQIELFPPHLRYLGSFWARRPPSGFFLPSVSIASLLAIMLWFAAHAHGHEAAGPRLALLAALMTLGALEHWMLVLPARRVELASLADDGGVAEPGSIR